MEMFLFVELQAATAGLALDKSGCFRQTRKKEIPKNSTFFFGRSNNDS
jgi:hypothetical protein